MRDYLINKIITLWNNAIFHSNTQAVLKFTLNNFEKYCKRNFKSLLF